MTDAKTPTVQFSSAQDPRSWNPTASFDSATVITCLTNGDAKKAEKLFNEMQAELSALQQENAKLRGILDGVSQDAIDGGWKASELIAYAKKLEEECANKTTAMLTVHNRLDKLREECEGLLKDAERYRWLRVRILNKYPEVMMLMVSEDEKAPSELDAAIDAALSPKNPT